MKTKICIITTSYPRYKGDFAGAFIHNLAKELVKEGIEVSVVAPHDVNTKNHEFIDDVEIYRFQYWFTKKGQRVAYGGGMLDNLAHAFLAKIQFPFFLLFFFLKGLKVGKKCDLIHAHWILSGFVAIFLKKMCKKPVVLTVWGSGLRKMPRKMSKFVLDNCDIISCHQPELIEILRSIGIRDIADIPTMIDYDKFGLRKNSSKFKNEFGINTESIIVFVARLIEFKDPLTFVRSVPLVIEKYKDTKFVIVGDGPLRNKIKEMISELGIQEYVIMTGARSDVDAILNASTIFVTLSQIENIWSTTIIEAIYSGVPCILTKAGYTDKIFTHQKNAYLIEPGNEKELADAIIHLLKDKEIRDKLLKNSLMLLKERGFSKDIIIKRTMEVYHRSLISKGLSAMTKEETKWN